jgi:hypothetical protein
MANTAHLVNNPRIAISRWLALSVAALSLIAALVSLRLANKEYKLNLIDRGALIGWILAFSVGANFERLVLATISIGSLGLVFAWWYHRRETSHDRATQIHHAQHDIA